MFLRSVGLTPGISSFKTIISATNSPKENLLPLLAKKAQIYVNQLKNTKKKGTTNSETYIFQTLGLPRMHRSARTRLRASRLLAPVAAAGAM